MRGNYLVTCAVSARGKRACHTTVMHHSHAVLYRIRLRVEGKRLHTYLPPYRHVIRHVWVWTVRAHSLPYLPTIPATSSAGTHTKYYTPPCAHTAGKLGARGAPGARKALPPPRAPPRAPTSHTTHVQSPRVARTRRRRRVQQPDAAAQRTHVTIRSVHAKCARRARVAAGAAATRAGSTHNACAVAVRGAHTPPPPRAAAWRRRTAHTRDHTPRMRKAFHAGLTWHGASGTASGMVGTVTRRRAACLPAWVMC
jgi:hypothetical protein